jgi:hypothetical protein
MARLFSVRFMAAVTVCAVAAVALVATPKIYSRANTKSPTLLEVLNIVHLPSHLRLYSGAVDESGYPLISADRAAETFGENGADVDKRYQLNKDLSTVDIALQLDGQHKAHDQSFYPTTAAGEGRRPQALTNYKGAAEEVVDQDVRAPSGKRLQWTHLADDGGKSIIDYADDGETVIGETLFDPPECCEAPFLKSQRRWLPDTERTLIYSDLRAEDGKRTRTKLDSHHRITWQMVCQDKRCYAAGTTVVGYYPGDDSDSPLKLRFKSESDYYTDDAKYYRLDRDGTLWYELKIGASTIDIIYYDATGTKPVLRQTFFRYDETGPDRAIKMTANSVYELYDLYEFDSTGARGNTFGFLYSKLDNVDVNNITINGVFYKEISLYFDRETGAFTWGVLFPDGPDSRISVDKSNFTPPPLPHPSPDEMRIQVPVIGDDLPVPTPQSSGYP